MLDGPLIVFFGLFSLFYATVFPIWMLADCILHKQLKRTGKISWSLVIVLLWFFGTGIYATFISKNKFAKILGGFFMLAVSFILLVNIWTYLFVLTRSPLYELDIKAVREIKSEISAVERDRVVESLQSLGPAMTNTVDLQNPERMVALYLHYRLREKMEDEFLSQSEYQAWINEFRLRKTIQPELLYQYESPPNVEAVGKMSFEEVAS